MIAYGLFGPLAHLTLAWFSDGSVAVIIDMPGLIAAGAFVFFDNDGMVA